jgi:putative endopeptidase
MSHLVATTAHGVIRSSAGFLPARFNDASFEFYGKKLNGTPGRPPHEQRAAEITHDHLGMALGKAYVERVFPPEAKQRATEMIEHIRGAIAEHINSLEWMSQETKTQALEKLAKVGVKVGYPDEWPSFEGLEVERGVHGNNVMRSRVFAETEDMAKIGQPVDKNQWHMTPSTVNAYYSPSGNEIVFPAAILQPPFFDAKADDAVNFGGIGVVIGHEFTHGFDDKGSQYDGEGNLRNWWRANDRTEFEKRGGAIKDQARSYEVAPGSFHNPDLIQGEALADLGGGTLALTALQNSLKGQGFDQKLDGFTPEQRFFQSFAQIWASNARPEYIQQQLATDSHPVSPFRVNQTLKNIPAFAAAFGVGPDDPMSLPEDKRAQLW